MTIEKELETAFKTVLTSALATAGITASVYGFLTDDSSGTDSEAASLPAVTVKTKPWLSEDGTRHAMLRYIETDITCATNYAVDKKRSTLEALYETARAAIETEADINNAMTTNVMQGCWVVGSDSSLEPVQSLTLTLRVAVRSVT